MNGHGGSKSDLAMGVALTRAKGQPKACRVPSPRPNGHIADLILRPLLQK